MFDIIIAQWYYDIRKDATDRRLAEMISYEITAQFADMGRLFLCVIIILAEGISNTKAC